MSEQPNKNLMIITEIEGLMSQVNDKLDKLKEENGLSCITKIPLRFQKDRITLIAQALEEIDLFQKTTLFELRKVFE